MSDKLLTIDEVAERLKVNPQTVRNWISRGELPETRVGARRVRVTESDLGQFLKLKDGAKQAASARPEPARRRRGTVRNMQAVDGLVETMLDLAATLPVGSMLARELAESAGRIQVVARVPGAGDTKHLRKRSDSPKSDNSVDGFGGDADGAHES